MTSERPTPIYAFRHANGGYLNKEGGEPCELCCETFISYSADDETAAVEVTNATLLLRPPCNEQEDCEP